MRLILMIIIWRAVFMFTMVMIMGRHVRRVMDVVRCAMQAKH